MFCQLPSEKFTTDKISYNKLKSWVKNRIQEITILYSVFEKVRGEYKSEYYFFVILVLFITNDVEFNR